MTTLKSLCMAGWLAFCASATWADTAATPQAPHGVLPPGPVPGGSVYNLKMSLETSRGESVTLDSFRGQPLLITMFYAQCTSICPLTTVTMQRIDLALTPEERARLRVLMVSLDPEHDTPTALRTFAGQHHVEDPRWTIALAKPGDVRLLAAALGIRYRPLPDGTFNHSAVISILDNEGTVLASSASVTAQDSNFQQVVERAVAAHATPKIDK